VPVADPQPRGAAIEQRIAGALEVEPGRQFPHLETVRAEPCGEQRLLATPLRVPEAARHEHVAAHEAGVRGERHVRQAGRRFDQRHVRMARHRFAQRSPLRRRARGVDAVDMPVHPRVDHVVHREMRGRTHQDAGRGRHSDSGRAGSRRSIGQTG